MNKSPGAALLAHIALGCTTLARIVKFTRKDGTVKRFTDHDVSVVMPSDGTYTPQDGVKFASVYSSVGRGVQNTELEIIFTPDGIAEPDVVRGVYDGAATEISLVNWADPSMGKIILLSGTVSTIGNEHKGYGTFEIRGLLHRADRMFGEVYSPECRADLGDSRCTVDIESLSQTITVTSVSNASIFIGSVPVEKDAEYYALGVITWLTGDNAGYSMEIMQDNVAGLSRTILLTLPMPFDVQVGDTGKIYVGCDKRIATCSSKFSNAANFRGEPPMEGAGFV